MKKITEDARANPFLESHPYAKRSVQEMKSAMIPKSHQASRVVVSGNTKRYGNVEGLKSNWDVNGNCITHIIKPSLFPARTLQASLLPLDIWQPKSRCCDKSHWKEEEVH